MTTDPLASSTPPLDLPRPLAPESPEHTPSSSPVEVADTTTTALKTEDLVTETRAWSFGEQVTRPPDADAVRAELLAVLLAEASPDRTPVEAFSKVASRGPSALRLVAIAWEAPHLLSRTLGGDGTPSELGEIRRNAGLALEQATNTMVRRRALERLDVVRANLRDLIDEIEQAGPRPRLAQLFETLEKLPFDARKEMLRAIDLHVGSPWLQGDLAAFLFEPSHPQKLDDPVAARTELLQSGEATYAGYALSLEGVRENFQGRLEEIDTAETFVRETPDALLMFRPVTRAIARGLPLVERLHAQARARSGGAVIEAPRAWWQPDFVAGVQGADVDLAETLLLAGLVDGEQVDLAEHRARFDVTMALSSLIAPFPVSGVIDDLQGVIRGPLDEMVGRAGRSSQQMLGIRLGHPVAGWLINQGFNMRMVDAMNLPTNLMRDAVQGDGRFDAPLDAADAAPPTP